MKTDFNKVQEFDEWMIKKVKSIYYHNNERMITAYERLTNKKQN